MICCLLNIRDWSLFKEGGRAKIRGGGLLNVFKKMRWGLQLNLKKVAK
jgi:hypothetical protein